MRKTMSNLDIKFYRVQSNYGPVVYKDTSYLSLEDAEIASIMVDCGYHDDGYLEVHKDLSRQDFIKKVIHTYKTRDTDINGQVRR